jgi:hypothetical protein
MPSDQANNPSFGGGVTWIAVRPYRNSTFGSRAHTGSLPTGYKAAFDEPLSNGKVLAM